MPTLISINILDMVLDLIEMKPISIGNGFGKNVTTFGVDMDSSVHADSKKKEILILVEGPTQGLEKKYSINFTESRKKFYLTLHYNRPNSCLFVNGVEIHKCKGKDSESVEKCIMPRKHCSRLFSR